MAGGGATVNAASRWGVHPVSDRAVYCMTKAAIATLTRCMGRNHSHQGILINAVCPNEVNTHPKMPPVGIQFVLLKNSQCGPLHRGKAA